MTINTEGEVQNAKQCFSILDILTFRGSTHLKWVSSTGKKMGFLAGAGRRHKKRAAPKEDCFTATKFRLVLLNMSSHSSCQVKQNGNHKMEAIEPFFNKDLFSCELHIQTLFYCFIVLLSDHLDYFTITTLPLVGLHEMYIAQVHIKNISVIYWTLLINIFVWQYKPKIFTT